MGGLFVVGGGDDDVERDCGVGGAAAGAASCDPVRAAFDAFAHQLEVVALGVRAGAGGTQGEGLSGGQAGRAVCGLADGDAQAAGGVDRGRGDAAGDGGGGGGVVRVSCPAGDGAAVAQAGEGSVGAQDEGVGVGVLDVAGDEGAVVGGGDGGDGGDGVRYRGCRVPCAPRSTICLPVTSGEA